MNMVHKNEKGAGGHAETLCEPYTQGLEYPSAHFGI